MMSQFRIFSMNNIIALAIGLESEPGSASISVGAIALGLSCFRCCSYGRKNKNADDESAEEKNLFLLKRAREEKTKATRRKGV